MYRQVIKRCRNCQNIWAESILYDDKSEDFIEENKVCPVCHGSDVTLIADSI